MTRALVARRGLASFDVLDLHVCDPARPAESHEEPFSAIGRLMKEHGVRIPAVNAHTGRTPPTAMECGSEAW